MSAKNPIGGPGTNQYAVKGRSTQQNPGGAARAAAVGYEPVAVNGVVVAESRHINASDRPSPADRWSNIAAELDGHEHLDPYLVAERAATFRNVMSVDGAIAIDDTGLYEQLLETGVAHRFMLVQRSAYNDDMYFTTHASVPNIEDYMEGEEYPDDWRVHRIIDLDSRASAFDSRDDLSDQDVTTSVSSVGEAMRAWGLGQTYPLADTFRFDNDDKPFTASFTKADAVHPKEAEDWVSAAFGSIGGELVQGFEPGAQSEGHDGADYVLADMKVRLPNGKTVWIKVECPTDVACD